jgi:phage terminase small subunit
MTNHKAPEGLAAAGRRLWRAIVGDLAEGMELDARELALLEAAARQADAVSVLERAVKRDGTMVKGASGQRRLNGAVSEVRQGRIALARLLGDLDLPADQAPRTASSRRAQKAAQVRWAEHTARKAARGG